VKLLIVDDEAPARSRLRRLLQVHADVQVVGEAADGTEALQQVAALNPDALLLDIQMPGVGGLDVAASLPDPAPALIFVTAFDRYALPAFDAAALDYLLKPVEPERLARALQRVRDRVDARHAVAAAPRRPRPSQLLIPDRGRTHVIAVAEILWLEAADNYVVVHTADRAPLMRRTLSALLVDLGDAFMRCHRGAAVALAAVQSLQPRDGGDGVLWLQGGQRVPCSRNLRSALLDRLAARAAGI
jgi:two-component system LytT family response regulator